MAARNLLAWSFIVLGAAMAAAGALGVARVSAFLPGDPFYPFGAGAFLVVGLLLLIVGVRRLVGQPARPRAQPPPSAPAPELVEIKRTEMRWGESQASPGPLEETLASLRQQMAQLKVRYGLGEVSGSTYTRRMKELEEQEAALERAQKPGGTP